MKSNKNVITKDKLRIMIGAELDQLPDKIYFKKHVNTRLTDSDFNKFSSDYPKEGKMVKKFRQEYFGTRAKVNRTQLSAFSREELYMIRDKINWKFFSKNYPINERLEPKFLPYLNWDIINQSIHLTFETIEKYQAILDFKLFQPPILNNRLVKFFGDRVDWKIASQIELDDEVLEKYKELVNWDLYLYKNQLSEDQLLKYGTYLDWKIVSATQNMSIDFILKHANRIDWSKIYNRPDYYAEFSIENDMEHIDSLNWDKYVTKPNLPNDIILKYFDKFIESSTFNRARDYNHFLNLLIQVDAGKINYLTAEARSIDAKIREKFKRSDAFRNQIFVKFYNLTLIHVGENYCIFESSSQYHEEYRSIKKWCFRFMFNMSEELSGVDKNDSSIVVIRPKKLPMNYLDLLATLLNNQEDAMTYMSAIISGITKTALINDASLKGTSDKNAYQIFKKYLKKYQSYTNDIYFQYFTKLHFGDEDLNNRDDI